MNTNIKLFSGIAILFSAAFLTSCGGDTETTKTSTLTGETSDTTETISKPVEEIPSEYADKKAVVLWSELGVRDKAGREGAKYLTTLVFGNQVTLTGDTATVDKRLYVEIKTPSGKEGWTQENLMALDAEVGVALSPLKLYRNPDLASVGSDKLEVGDIVAVYNNEEVTGFKQIGGYKFKPKGWIKDNKQLSTDPNDVAIAFEMKRAMSQEVATKKQEMIAEILQDNAGSSSPLYIYLQEQLNKMEGSSSTLDDEASEMDVPNSEMEDE